MRAQLFRMLIVVTGTGLLALGGSAVRAGQMTLYPGIAGASGITEGPGLPARVPSLASTGALTSVAATTASTACAVGRDGDGKTLIVHWNGATWNRTPGPTRGAPDILHGVAASSPRSAWAVGSLAAFAGKILTVRWNGAAWRLTN